MKHFLDIHTTDKADLRSIIDQALAMKTARNNRPKGTPDDEQPLAGRMVALIFEKPSTRTRVSFDVGVRQMGGQTMVLSGSEIAKADNHGQDNMPFLLAGKGGGLRGGRHLRYPDVAHNDLLVSIANAFGIATRSFGLPEYSSGPLPGLFG